MEEKIHRAKKRIWNDICSLKYCIILLAVYAVATQLAFGTVCPMVIFCGLPCPGCGLTRAVCSILLGDLKSAVEYNLTAFLWLPFLLLLLWERYLTAKKIFSRQGVIIFVALVTVVYYLYRMKMFFPGEPPLVYQPENIMAWILQVNT